MRIQLIEHHLEDCSRNNISLWAADKGYRVDQIFLFDTKELPPIDSFDRLMVMGGSQYTWDAKGITWLQKEKEFASNI